MSADCRNCRHVAAVYGYDANGLLAVDCAWEPEPPFPAWFQTLSMTTVRPSIAESCDCYEERTNDQP